MSMCRGRQELVSIFLFPVNVSHSYISFKNSKLIVVETIYHFDIKDLFSLEYDMII